MAMCGGLLAAMTTRDGVAKPMLPARAIAARQLAYQVGRISTYALLGAAFGATGALALHAAHYLPLQRALYAAANVFLLLLAPASCLPHRVLRGCSGQARRASARS